MYTHVHLHLSVYIQHMILAPASTLRRSVSIRPLGVLRQSGAQLRGGALRRGQEGGLESSPRAYGGRRDILGGEVPAACEVPSRKMHSAHGSFYRRECSSLTSLPRSSSREVRIRVPTFSVVCFTRGTLPRNWGTQLGWLEKGTKAWNTIWVRNFKDPMIRDLGMYPGKKKKKSGVAVFLGLFGGLESAAVVELSLRKGFKIQSNSRQPEST